MLPARSARRLRKVLIVFYTTTITISLSLSLSLSLPPSLPLSLSLSLVSVSETTKTQQNAKRRRSASKWIERVEFAGFDAWEKGWRELGGEARQSSRRQSYRRDIVPPIAIYIRPLSIQPYASATYTFRSSLPAHPLPSLRTQPLASTSYLPPISLQPSLSLPPPLSLSLRRFPSTRSQPLFSPPLFATIALLPPFRNALGLRVGVERE